MNFWNIFNFLAERPGKKYADGIFIFLLKKSRKNCMGFLSWEMKLISELK